MASRVDLLHLGVVPWLDTQLVYHALARLGRDAVVLCRPETPYVSIGYHQDLETEVDLGYCHGQGLPVFRREIGGGAVCLDRDQLFYQVVLRRDNLLVPRDPRRFFQRFLEPVIRALGDVGVAAEFVPHCDLQVGGRKISGNGGGDIEGFAVLAGDILLDFDFHRMARVLHLPSPGFRALVRAEMEERVTTLARELGSAPPVADLEAALTARFAEALPGLSASRLGDDLREQCRSLERAFASEEWLFEPGKRLPHREVKIAEGTVVYWFPTDGDGEGRGVAVVSRGGRLRSARILGTDGRPQTGGEDLGRFLGRRLEARKLRGLAPAPSAAAILEAITS